MRKNLLKEFLTEAMLDNGCTQRPARKNGKACSTADSSGRDNERHRLTKRPFFFQREIPYPVPGHSQIFYICQMP
ncbi:MAG: hypothetical protein JO356_16780 [Acidobacteria bacterium]|nr:hypothetical protein [Acidobacteriota bacterium]